MRHRPEGHGVGRHVEEPEVEPRSERRDVLAAVWQTEKRMERTKPSPFLWTRLQARIKEYEQALVFVWNLKSAMQGITMQPLSILAIVGAIIVGIYLGTPRKSQGYIGGRSNIQLAGVGDELGLDKFDLIPPGTLGKTVVNMYNTQK